MPIFRGQKNSSVKKRLNVNSARLRIKGDNTRNNKKQNNVVNAKLNINNVKMHSGNGWKTSGVNNRKHSNDGRLKLTELYSEISGMRNKGVKDKSNSNIGAWNLFTL